VLVRPDQYVAWAGDGPPRDAAQLIQRVAGRSKALGADTK